MPRTQHFVSSSTLVAAFVAALVASASSLRAQTAVVYHDDAALVAPPATAFPFYTPGAGSTGQTVRLQTFCPASFAGLPSLPGLVRSVWLQIAGTATYSRFEVRAGVLASPVPQGDWALNLPDQRLQADLSGRPLVGGSANGAPANAWIEIPLAAPFAWQPGQGLVVDLITTIATVGSYCGTGTSSAIGRVYDFGYTGGTLAPAVQTSGGLKVGFTFAPFEIVPFGQGCPGAGNPQLAGLMLPQLAAQVPGIVTLQGALPNAPAALLLGLQRVTTPLGGGCDLLVSPDALLLVRASPQGLAGFPLTVPPDPRFAGTVVHAQWAVLDALSPSPLGVATSQGGTLVVLP